MQGTLTPPLGKSLALAALAAALSATACQDMNAFVTGEKFSRAPQGSPRVEVELVVETQDSFYDEIEGEGKLDEAITQQVLSMADLGMRFYPVLSSEYGSDDVRPPYVMVVQVLTLDVNADHKLIEEKGQEPRISSSVESLDCAATASVKKRRADGPPLIVGDGEGKGHVYVRSDAKALESQVTFPVKRTSEEHEALQVTEKDVMAVVEEAVVDALRTVLKPVDRDLTLGDSVEQ
jgi:hypothetical protein